MPPKLREERDIYSEASFCFFLQAKRQVLSLRGQDLSDIMLAGYGYFAYGAERAARQTRL